MPKSLIERLLENEVTEKSLYFELSQPFCKFRRAETTYGGFGKNFKILNRFRPGNIVDIAFDINDTTQEACVNSIPLLDHLATFTFKKQIHKKIIALACLVNVTDPEADFSFDALAFNDLRRDALTELRRIYKKTTV